MRRRVGAIVLAALLIAAFPAPAGAWRIKTSDRKVHVIAGDGEENFIGVDIVTRFEGQLLIKVVDDEEKKVRIENTNRCSEGRRGHVFCFVDPAIRNDDNQPITVDLGDGDDVFVNDTDIGVEVEGGEGNDAMLGGEGTDVLEGGEGDDVINAWESSDDDVDDQVLRGDEGNDFLVGDEAHETLEGGEGDDVINGGPGDDKEDGGEGNDLLHAQVPNVDYYDAGVDELIGGPGIDRADFRDSPLERDPVAGAVVKSGVRAVIGGEAIAYRSVQHPGQPEQVEELATDNLASDVEGLIGTQGEDRLSAENGVGTGGGEGSSPAIAVLLGMEGDDELVGGSTNDLLEGLAGNDLLQGNGGGDRLDGGEGVDQASYADAYHVQKAAPVAVTMHDTTANDGEVTTVGPTRSEGDLVLAVENLVGGPANDTLFGTVGPNRIAGGDGNDRIVGGAGVDELIGGRGKDTLHAADAEPPNQQPAADLVQCLAGDIVGVDRVDILEPDSRGACERVYYKRGPLAAPVRVQLPAAGSVDYVVTDPLPAARGGGRSLDFVIDCGSAACSGRVVMQALPSRSPVGSRAFAVAPNGRRFVRVRFTPTGAELVDRPGPLGVVAVIQTRAGTGWVTRGTVKGTIGTPAARE